MRQQAFSFYADLPEEILWKPESVEFLRDGLLTDAIQQLFDGKCGNRERMEILAWILETDRQNPFSFAVCCEAAGLDADSLREKTLRHFIRNRKPAGDALRRLVLADATAILLDAMEPSKERMRAAAWMGDANCDKPFGFKACCEASGKKSGEVRHAVFVALKTSESPSKLTELLA